MSQPTGVKKQQGAQSGAQQKPKQTRRAPAHHPFSSSSKSSAKALSRGAETLWKLCRRRRNICSYIEFSIDLFLIFCKARHSGAHPLLDELESQETAPGVLLREARSLNSKAHALMRRGRYREARGMYATAIALSDEVSRGAEIEREVEREGEVERNE